MSKKSQVVSGLGLGLGMLTLADEVRRAYDIPDEQFHILGSPDGRKYWEMMFTAMQSKERVSMFVVETDLLKPIAQATVPARTKPFVASEFYQSDTGLCDSDTFADRFDLSVRKMADSTPERLYVASLLKANAYDRDIRKDLPDEHLSTLEDIASLIEAQPNGKKGILLTNGWANIFYVEGKNGEVFVVGVEWSSSSCSWDVDDWELISGRWSAGDQVLCPRKRAALTLPSLGQKTFGPLDS